MKVGQRIREERERHGWTQSDLARRLHVSRQSISKWENGTAYPDIDKLVQLSDLFQVSLDDLVRGKKPAQLPQPKKKGMTFWDFLSYRWWIIFIIAWCLAWLLPVVIHAIRD